MFVFYRPNGSLGSAVLRLAALLLWSLALNLAQAQTPGTGPVITTPQMRAELVAYAPQGVQAGQPVWLGLQLQHAPGWHTYWLNPGDSGLPTQMTWTLPAGVQAGEIVWPLPSKLRAGHLTNYGFEHTTLLAVPLTLDKRFQPRQERLDIRLHASWLICQLECIPQEGDFGLSVATRSSLAAQAGAFEALLAQQPQTPSQLSASARFEEGQLQLNLQGLPTSWQGQALRLFPDTPELLESAAEQHPQATQSWQADRWQARLPLSHMRSTEPTQLRLLLTTGGDGAARQAAWVQVKLPTPWPAVNTQPSPPTPARADAPPPADATLSWGLALALAGALLGGLILNLMPCVLPVLAIKLLGFAQHSRQHRAHRLAGLGYTAGVVMSFLLLGSLVLLLRASGEELGWGFQLQSPWVVSALAVLFTLIALNLLGWFDVGQWLPSRWLSLQAHHPALDALLSGVLAVAVAAPCTAPFMGASLGLAMTLPTWQALGIFASMGLGLALPYLVVSWWPAAVRLLPHPGPWMLALRQLLAFPMLATVIWLLWVLGLQQSLDATIGLLSLLLALCAWLWSLRFKTRLAHLVSLGLALVVVLVAATFQAELRQEAPRTVPQTQNNDTDRREMAWQAWSPAAEAAALAQGRPVFIDFTAAWCVTCQINKKTTLANTEVLRDLRQHHVTLLRADWTRRDPAITAALRALGRSGVPVYVLQAPGKPPHVLSELLRVDELRQALSELPTEIEKTE